MKQLMQSSKFWAITIGSLLGSGLYYLLGDGEGLSNGFPMLLVGAYGTIGALDQAGKAFNKIKNGSTE
jgi:hypothetical protein